MVKWIEKICLVVGFDGGGRVEIYFDKGGYFVPRNQGWNKSKTLILGATVPVQWWMGERVAI